MEVGHTKVINKTRLESNLMTKGKKKAETKTGNTTVVVNQQPAASTKKTRNRRRRGGNVTAWTRSVVNPFESAPARVPDADTRPSGLVTSRYHTRYQPRNYDGSGSTTFAGGFLMRPYPSNWLLPLGTLGGDVYPNYYTLNVNLNSGMEWVSAPNITSLIGNYGSSSTPTAPMCLVRCVGMGIRITYEGTELQRAGSFVGVEVLNNNTATTFSTADSGGVNYHYDPLSVYQTLSTSVQANTPSEWMNFATRSVRKRIDDNVFEMIWVPNGAPSYQQLNLSPPTSYYKTSTVGQLNPETLYGSPKGMIGLDYGEGGILAMIEGDTIASTDTTGNYYSVDAVAHWEVIPHDVYSITYQVSQSPYVNAELEKALNTFANLRVANARASANSNVISNGRPIMGSGSAFGANSTSMMAAALALAGYLMRSRGGRQRGQLVMPPPPPLD